MALFRRSGIWRDVRPVGAIGDFIEVFRQAGANRWRFAVLATLPPLGIFAVFVNEEVRGKPHPPKIDYIVSWPADRTEAEIRADIAKNERRKARIAAEQAKRDALRQEMYMSLGRATGIDVDAIKRKADAERAAEQARAEAEAVLLRERQQQADAAKP
jgi:hypothetical protein